MSNIVILNKEVKSLFPCLFCALDFKRKSYQVHYINTSPIRTTNKMIAFTIRVQNYIHHLKSQKGQTLVDFLVDHPIST